MIKQRFIKINGVRYFIKQAGNPTAPLILFLHGFPDSWYSWRHQLEAMAAAGYYAVAPDMLGCGETDAPMEIERYSQDEMAKDIAGLIERLGHEQAIIVGHDLGASLAWQICLLYQEKVKAVIALSIPYGGRALAQPIPHMKKVFGDKFFYILYFQKLGVAEGELDADVHNSLLRIYFSLGAEGSEIAAQYVANDNPISAENYLDTTIRPEKLPKWLKAEDLAYYVGRYEKKGFRGILNWYRCLDIYWKRTEHLAGKKITQPTYFIAGKNDPINYMVRKAIKRLPNVVEDLRGVEFFDDCGHWIPCEQTELLNEKLLKYIGEVVGMK
jgi:pimeloyl-ACP methyl ester carboxylesterase